MKIERPISKQPIPDHAKKVFEGVIFDVYQWEQEMYDGGVTTFEKIARTDSAITFGVTPEGKILLTYQQQPGKDPVYAAAGGRMERGEDPFEIAQKELLEETGHTSDDWQLWMALQPSVKIDYAVYIFIAKNCKQVADLSPDWGEKIELRPVTFEEFVEIGSDENFYEQEIFRTLLEAKHDQEKMKELKKLFAPNV